MDEGLGFYKGLPQWNAIMLLYDMFLRKPQNLNYGSYEKRKWAYRRNGFVGLKQGVQIDDTHTTRYSAFSRGGIVPWASFQLILNFHMARRMHFVWLVSLFLPNNPKSVSTPLAQAPTHAFE